MSFRVANGTYRSEQGIRVDTLLVENGGWVDHLSLVPLVLAHISHRRY